MADVYKIKKGDTLSGIAKQHGHKKWETIWDAPENKALVSKRKKPELIQPGDQLTIPPNENDKKAADEALAKTNALKDTLKSQEEKLKQQIKSLNEVIAEHEQMSDRFIKELEGTLKSLKKVANAVDFVKEVTEFRGTVLKIGQIGASAIGKHHQKLEKAGKEILHEVNAAVKEKDKDKLIGSAVKTLEEHNENFNQAIGAVTTTYQAWENMAKPSFWAKTVSGLMNGKTWSEAVSQELGADIEKQITDFKTQSEKQTKAIEQRRDRLTGQLQDLTKMRARLDQNIAKP